MRRLFPISALFVAACATTPTPSPVATPTKPADTRPQGGDLIGLNVSDLGARLGQPRIQVREGDGTKLQFAGKSCVLDAYLYPPSGGKGLMRVTHVDTRDRAGRDVDQARCITDIEAR